MLGNASVVRLSAAEIQQLSDHLASALMMYRAVPSASDTSGGEADVWHALLNLETWAGPLRPAAPDQPMRARDLREFAHLITRATQSPHPWPDGRRNGGRTDAAACAAALHARCHGAAPWPTTAERGEGTEASMSRWGSGGAT